MNDTMTLDAEYQRIYGEALADAATRAQAVYTKTMRPMARHRFDLIDQEQLAAQLVAVMDAHFQRPTYDEKLRVLELAMLQIAAHRALTRSDSQAASQH